MSDRFVEERNDAAYFATGFAMGIQIAGGRIDPPACAKELEPCWPNDKDDCYVLARNQAANCALTLAQAIQQAGGTVNTTYLGMTVGDFISQVAAHNHIVFQFQKPDDDKGE